MEAPTRSWDQSVTLRGFVSMGFPGVLLGAVEDVIPIEVIAISVEVQLILE